MPVNDSPQTETSSARSLCWSCRQDTGKGPFCKHCIKIQPVDELGNYFDLFDLGKSFEIDQNNLKKKFFALSRKFHPDYYSSGQDEEQKLARDNTAYLNHALSTLSDPVQRAEYLLSLVSGSYANSPTPPQELFEEILEVGELLESQSLSIDENTRLTHAGESFRQRQNELADSLAELFSQLLGGNDGAKGEIESRLNQIKYLRKTGARIETALMEKDNHE